MKTYTSGQVARLLAMPVRTTRRYIESGRIPGTQHPITGTWKVGHNDLLGFMKQHDLDTSYLEQGARMLAVGTEPELVEMVRSGIAQLDPAPELEVLSSIQEALIRLGQWAPELLLLLGNSFTHMNSVRTAIKATPRTRRTMILQLVRDPADHGGMARYVESLEDVVNILRAVFDRAIHHVDGAGVILPTAD